MTSEPRELRFYFDFISPYAYLGWTQIHAVAGRHACRLDVRPVLFAAALNTWGQKGPAEIVPKRLYTWKHVVRLAHDLGVPIKPPPAHPFNPLLALRIATLPLSESEHRTVIDQLFRMAWVSGEGVTDREAVIRGLNGIGLDGARLVEQAGGRENKDRLKRTTQEAVEAGLFGVPTVVVDGEMFWGQDSFPHLERFLKGEDPLGDMTSWLDLPVGASR